MSDTAVAPDTAPPSQPAPQPSQTEVPVNPNPVSAPAPVGSQAPGTSTAHRSGVGSTRPSASIARTSIVCGPGTKPPTAAEIAAHEAVQLFVAKSPGATLSEADLIAHCRTKLAGYKCPKAIEFRSELARTATGKLQKFKLRAPYWEGRERQVN